MLKHFFTIEKNQVVPISEPVRLNMELSEATLMYTWGAADHGKLGIGVTGEVACEKRPDFLQEDLGRVVEDFDEFDKESFFTPSPQPVVSMLGM